MLNILQSFKKLALDDLKCDSLLKDNSSLGGLVILLSNESDQTVFEILEIFLILIKKPKGIYHLKKIQGLRDQLHCLSNSRNRDSRILNATRQLVQSIYYPKPDEPLPKLRERKLFDYKKSRSIVVELNGSITKSDLKTIESELVKIRGVISITFQLAKCRVVVLALSDVEPEIVLNQVTEGCRLASLSAEHKSISARVIRRQKSTYSRVDPNIDFDRRSCVSTATTKAAPKTLMKSTQHAYLADNADLFEVDESRGAPQRQNVGARNNAGGGGGGIGGWLSDLIERTVFW